MLTEKIRAEYDRWCALATDLDIKAELESMDENMIEDAFYRDLAFVTGGLRGTIGAGTNRMNVYVVAKDYRVGLNGLPKSDVLKFFTESGSVVIRPSGTEPKLKLYISVTAEDKASAEESEKKIIEGLEKRF